MNEILIQLSPSSCQARQQTLTSLETALHFALKGEETLWRECDRLKDNPEQYELLCEAWREQEKACKDIMRTLKNLNQDFKHPAFEDTYGSNILKRYPQRLAEGILSHQL
jgi:hypothetical protein